MGKISVSKATVACGVGFQKGTDGGTQDLCIRKAAFATAVMCKSRTCIGASDLQVLLTTRLLGQDRVSALGHNISQVFTDHGVVYAPLGSNVADLAQKWKEFFDAEPREVQDAVTKAHELLSAGCSFLLFEPAQVEHLMCELRKFLDDSQSKRN